MERLVTRIYYDDLDLTLSFGIAQEDARVAAWIKDPVYPKARTGWTDDDVFFLNSVFMPGYGEDAVPFPKFASYAMILDEDVFNTREEIYYTDGHGTESDLSDYISELQQAGFTETSGTLNDGSNVTLYRRLLREDYHCYVSVYPHIEDGFVLEAFKYYDEPEYEGLEEVNTAIKDHGFAELPESEHFSGWIAVDHAASRSESWLYFFDYDMSLEVSVGFDSSAETDTYMNEYGDRLTDLGFLADVISGDEESTAKYKSPDGSRVFQYWYTDDSMVMEFRVEKSVSAAGEAQKITDVEP